MRRLSRLLSTRTCQCHAGDDDAASAVTQLAFNLPVRPPPCPQRHDDVTSHSSEASKCLSRMSTETASATAPCDCALKHRNVCRMSTETDMERQLRAKSPAPARRGERRPCSCLCVSLGSLRVLGSFALVRVRRNAAQRGRDGAAWLWAPGTALLPVCLFVVVCRLSECWRSCCLCVAYLTEARPFQEEHAKLNVRAPRTACQP